MELIDRYLQSVKSALPKRQQEDVVRELTDEVLSRVEEKEDALGRPLMEDEQVALLKELGHPWLLASHYRKRRYLIDPALFALYWIVVRLVLVVMFVAMAIGAITMATTGHSLLASLGTFIAYPFAALKALAIVTLGFMVLDILQAKCSFFERWDPRTLPKLNKSQKRPSTFENAAGLILGAVFGVWWLVGLKHQFWLLGPGAAFVRLGPIFQTLYPLYVALVLVDITRHTIALLRPSLEWARTILRLLSRVINLLALYLLLRAPDFFVPAAGLDTKLYEGLKGVNQAIHLGLTIAAVIATAQFAWDLYKTFIAGNRQQEIVCL